MDWKGICVTVFNSVICIGDCFGCILTRSDSINEFELRVRQDNIAIIEIISDSAPPVLILGFLNELLDLITLFALFNFTQLIVIAKMCKFIVPMIRYSADSDFDLLIISII
jgi:hypothetical protein